MAASAKVGDIVGRPASLPVSHWAQHQRHHHVTAHPHLGQDLMSCRHFRRPTSAQPWLNSRHKEGSAAVCSTSPRHKNQQVQSDSSASIAVQLQACHVDGLASGLQSGAHDYSTAASISVHRAPACAAHEGESVSRTSSQAAVCDYSKPEEVQLEYLDTSPSEPEASSCAVGPDTSSLHRQDTVGIARSWQQPESNRHLGIRAGSHSRVKMREQEWPPQGARWRSATLYKLQANSMHLPTAKVCCCSHACPLCLTCGIAQSSDKPPETAAPRALALAVQPKMALHHGFVC